MAAVMDGEFRIDWGVREVAPRHADDGRPLTRLQTIAESTRSGTMSVEDATDELLSQVPALGQHFQRMTARSRAVLVFVLIAVIDELGEYAGSAALTEIGKASSGGDSHARPPALTHAIPQADIDAAIQEALAKADTQVVSKPRHVPRARSANSGTGQKAGNADRFGARPGQRSVRKTTARCFGP
jgi:hypothetical protein